DWAKVLLYYLVCLATGGLFAIVCSWFPNHRFLMKHSRTPLSRAKWVLVHRKGLAASRTPQYARIEHHETFQLIEYEHLRYISLLGSDYNTSGFRHPVFDIHKSYSDLFHLFGKPGEAGFSPELAQRSVAVCMGR